MIAALDLRDELARIILSGYSHRDGVNHWRVPGKTALVVPCLLSQLSQQQFGRLSLNRCVSAACFAIDDEIGKFDRIIEIVILDLQSRNLDVGTMEEYPSILNSSCSPEDHRWRCSSGRQRRNVLEKRFECLVRHFQPSFIKSVYQYGYILVVPYFGAVQATTQRVSSVTGS